LFNRKSKEVLNMYCTAGFPKLASTMEVIRALHQHGADLIEIGMPYSDPLADGPVIQNSSTVALENGMTLQVLFDQLKALRLSELEGGVGNDLPVVLMGYMNPILQYGFENFCAAAQAVGVDGLILPDLPLFEFETEYRPILKQFGLDFIFLITPETSEARIRAIDAQCSGFLYAVSSSSTTGNNKAIELQTTYFQQLEAMQLKNPILVGFGIKDFASFKTACTHTNGAIIGSAYIKAIESADDIQATTKEFIKTIRQESL
ncbi:MAG: hypothetical protein RLY16_2402, partial [Bacteroidota bacterium]